MREDHTELTTEAMRYILTIAGTTASKISEGTEDENRLFFSSALGILCGSLTSFIQYSICDVDARKETYKKLYDICLEADVDFEVRNKKSGTCG